MESTTSRCGCCQGTEALTPRTVANRPGLAALSYRCGTHATFLETMRARLSSLGLVVPGLASDESDRSEGRRIYPLRRLTTRDPDDPSIALLDAWATIADVLTFYQERIANEGYLRTATERRSVCELARLLGYRLRPGVAASVYLALELDAGRDVDIQPHGLKAQSVPGPGELPQVFENIERIDARHAWNALRPRLTQPQTLQSITRKGDTHRSEARGQDEKPIQPRLYVKGIGLNLKPNDVVLITIGGSAEQGDLYRVANVEADARNDRTLVTFQGLPTGSGSQIAMGDTPAEKARAFAIAIASGSGGSLSLRPPSDPLKNVMVGLTKPPSVPPRNALSLERNLRRTFERRADTGLQVAGTLNGELGQFLPVALANVKVTADTDVRAFVFRATARPFGHNAMPRPVLKDDNYGKYTSYHEWDIYDPLGLRNPRQEELELRPSQNGFPPHHKPDVLYLDGEYKIQSSGWIYIDHPELYDPLFLDLSSGEAAASQVSLTAYGISGKSTRLELSTANWFNPVDASFALVRETTIHCESEELPLAEEPIEAPICGGAEDLIELDALHSGLQSGRWLIVSGERDDIEDEAGRKVRGIKAAELAMLGEVTQTVKEVRPQVGGGHYHDQSPVGRPGDQTHSFITLARKLQYCYRRDSVSIHANVVKATHGESRPETLGGGDGGRAFQSFTLKQPPLTFVSSPTAAGAESTLKVYVNDVQWHEVDNPVELGPTDRNFITKTNNEGTTTVVFGNGEHGARLPTGIENIRAQYRSGIGRTGNVPAERISTLTSKPLGVKGVANPLRASGGADKESRDTARKNAPLTVTALDRLVSVSDYADFARTFAGVGKAVSARIGDGRREWVHVTVAGADDIPIDETSDLLRNLLQALRSLGDPNQPVALQVRELMLLVIGANIRVLPDYRWESVAKAVRDKLYDTFSFERRELGQDVCLSHVIAAVQSVAGVAYVDVDVLGGIPEKKTAEDDQGRPIRRLLTPQEMAEEAAGFLNEDPAGMYPRQRLKANLAGFDNGAMRPAQLLYLTPAVADTLVLNQISG